MRRQPPGGEGFEGRNQAARAVFGEGVVQFRGRGARAHIDSLLQTDRAGIEARLDLHHREAVAGITGEDRVGDRRGPAPAGQQRRMQIHAAVMRRGIDRLGQQQAVGDDDADFGPQFGECAVFGFVAEGLGRADRQAERSGGGVDRGLLFAVAAPGGPGRQGIDRGDVVAGGVERAQRRHGELRRAEEHQPHRQAASDCLNFFALASFRRMMLRRTGDRRSTSSTPSRWSSSCCRQRARTPVAFVSTCSPPRSR